MVIWFEGPVHHGGEARQQKPDTTGYIVSTATRQQEPDTTAYIVSATTRYQEPDTTGYIVSAATRRGGMSRWVAGSRFSFNSD